MQRILIVFFGFVLLTTGCTDRTIGPLGPEVEILSEKVTLNPSGFAPLTASIEIETSEAVRIGIRIEGKNGSDSDIVHLLEDTGTSHTVPVLGLYPDHTNTVELTYFDAGGRELGRKEYRVETDPLLPDLPNVVINEGDPSRMPETLTFVSYFGHREGGEPTPQRPFIFDSFGDIRWYLDFRQHFELSELFYDDGMERLRNGNLYFGDTNSNKIYEIDMLGHIRNSWEMPGYGFHHEVKEKPDGNFLVTVNKHGAPTIEDHIIEIDRETGQIVTVWDLRESLDRTRTAWNTPFGDISVDWFHANALYYDATDNTIVVSGRTQGVVKLTEDNRVVWIIAPHKEWDTSGNGTDLTQFLLQPLDSNDRPISDPAVLSGEENHPEFEWSWYQHAPLRMPNGNVMLFDNGDNRNYTGNSHYSRAVEYEIDPDAMTIKQVWTYGKARGGDTYSQIVSDVDFHPDDNSVFFIPGAVNNAGDTYGKVIEVDYSRQQVLFEATIHPPAAAFGIITLHRAERMRIYPEPME